MQRRRSSNRNTSFSLFKEQPSILLRAAVLSVLALCLMVADTRMHLVPVISQGVSIVIAPFEWAARQPVNWWNATYSYFSGVQEARVGQDAARIQLAQQSLRAAMVENLALENTRLRALLGLREREALNGRAAEVLYEAPDPYAQRLIVDRGLVQGIRQGAPVLDDLGVIGQVSRALPLTAEVTLLTNVGFSVAVTNARTGVFGMVYGDPDAKMEDGSGGLELRLMPANADVRVGDLLITSGIDGVYPVGLPVARVIRVEHDPVSFLAQIWCTPVARIHNTRYVMVVSPSGQLIEDSEQMEGAYQPQAADRVLPSAQATAALPDLSEQEEDRDGE